MRLRQLGTTQSIAFFAPPEVHASILQVCKLDHDAVIDSSNVIHWLLEQTCCAIQQRQNLYLAQGEDFCRRTDAQLSNAEFLANEHHREEVLSVIKSPAGQTLEQLYGGTLEGSSRIPLNSSQTTVNDYIKELNRRRQMVSYNGHVMNGSALEAVEQERMIEVQKEEERQIEKPADYAPLTFPGLHTRISSFVETGFLSDYSNHVHAFIFLSRTALGQKYGVRRTTSRLFLSKEFTRTVRSGYEGVTDNFLVS